MNSGNRAWPEWHGRLRAGREANMKLTTDKWWAQSQALLLMRANINRMRCPSHPKMWGHPTPLVGCRFRFQHYNSSVKLKEQIEKHGAAALRRYSLHHTKISHRRDPHKPGGLARGL